MGDFAESLRLSIAIGMTVFMVVLRFDQERIMRSDYFRSRSRWMGPLSYYGLVLLFTAGIILILPRGRASLFLVGADASELLPVMLAFAVVGTLNGAALALVRFRSLVPLPLDMLPSRTVGAALNAMAEELQFRSVILGLMLVGGLDAGLAVALQAVIFGAAHRRVWRERDWYFVVGSVILGYACGLATISTQSVIPAMVGHFAVTMGIFAFAGGRLRMQRI
ncbi:MAG TPA: CPBP family intramembrane glutamic endopeptidase [Candidatus Limnocylindria bacterium]|nr:CPBP family intramembrane glutamic endopeptidase [Candidatus Limnocylindria bacterium]